LEAEIQNIADFRVRAEVLHNIQNMSCHLSMLKAHFDLSSVVAKKLVPFSAQGWLLV